MISGLGLKACTAGLLTEFHIEGDVYKAEMTRSGADYSAEIDAETGSVISLFQTGEIKEEIPQLLSEAKVKEIIAGKYSGNS